MEINKLKYFQIVAKYQHVTKAADEIHIAQPSLTQAIHSLEEELGVPLFKKNGRRIVLTEFGTYLKNRLDEILPPFDNLPLEMEQLKSKVNKTVKLNILAASSLVINAIVAFRKIHPDVIFDFEQTAQGHGYDILVTTNDLNEVIPKCKGRRCIKEEKIYLAVPTGSKYENYDSINLQDVKDEGFIMFSNSRLFGVICNKFCSVAGFRPKVLFETDSPSAMQNIISTGIGIAFWPEYSWGKMRNKNVKLLPISNPVCQRELIFDLELSSPKSVHAEEFYEFLLKRIKQ